MDVVLFLSIFVGIAILGTMFIVLAITPELQEIVAPGIWSH